MGRAKNSSEEIEISGYIVSVMPRTWRGLLEYKLKMMTLGGRSEIMYMHEPKIPLKPGIPVKVRAILSKQSENPRWMINSIEVLKEPEAIEPVQASIDEVIKGVYCIVHGRSGEKIFSMPIPEELLRKIPENLPQELYCIFMNQGHQVTIVEIMRKDEYEVFVRALSFLHKLDEEELEGERAVDEYLKYVKQPYLETAT